MSCRNVSARHFLPSATYLLPSATHLLPSARHLLPSATHLLPSARHFLPSATHFLPSATHLLPSAAHLPSAKNWLLKHTSCAAESARNFVIPHSENGPGTFNCQSKTAFVGFNVSF